MKKNKKTDERNSLEQLLLRWRDSYKENKSRVSLVLVLIALVIIAVWLVRTVQFSGSSRDANADGAYYAAVDNDAVAVAVNLKSVAGAYNNRGYGSVLAAESGDAYVRDALNSVAARRLYSAGRTKEKPGDPSASFLEAISSYEEAAKSNDVDVQARAFYNLASVYENIASISQEAEVEKNLDSAKENLKKVIEIGGSSPYVALAQSRLSQLERSTTVDYYKTVAKAYIELPEPSETPSILSEKSDELKVGEPAANGEEFSLNEDASEESIEPEPETVEPAAETAEPSPEAVEPAETTESAPETAEPAAETTESVPEAAEPAAETAESAPEATEPAAETTESAPEAAEPAAETAESAPETAEPAAETAESAPEATEPAAETAESAPEEVPAE